MPRPFGKTGFPPPRRIIRSRGEGGALSKRRIEFPSYFPQMMRLAAMGTELVGWLVFPTLLGYWLDARFSTAPILVIVGGILGIAGGLTSLVRRAYLIARAVERSSRERNDVQK